MARRGLTGTNRMRINIMALACPYRKLKTADRDRESADTRSR
jgi:hypothetical protein